MLDGSKWPDSYNWLPFAPFILQELQWTVSAKQTFLGLNCIPPRNKNRVAKNGEHMFGISDTALELHRRSVMAYLRYVLEIEFAFFTHTATWLEKLDGILEKAG